MLTLNHNKSLLPIGRTECDCCHKVRLDKFFEVMYELGRGKVKWVKYTSCEPCRQQMEPSQWKTY